MDRRLFLLVSLALGGCATLARAPAGPPLAMAELEPLYAVAAGPDGLRIAAASQGCTAKGDLTFYVERRGGKVSVAFARRHVDACKADGRTEIDFSWQELGLDPGVTVFLLNPLGGLSAPSMRSRRSLRP